MENTRVKKLKALEFLCENRFGVISTISSEDSNPQGSLVYYDVYQRFINLKTTKQSRKLRNLSKRKNIALTVFTEIPPLELQVEGITEVINDSGEKEYISNIYLEHANKNPETINWPPILKLPNDEGFEFIRITITYFKFSDFSETNSFIVEGTPADWQ